MNSLQASVNDVLNGLPARFSPGMHQPSPQEVIVRVLEQGSLGGVRLSVTDLDPIPSQSFSHLLSRSHVDGVASPRLGHDLGFVTLSLYLPQHTLSPLQIHPDPGLG